MVFWLELICAALSVTVILLLVKIYLLRRSLGQLVRDLRQLLEGETNVLLSVSTGDREVRRLASELNGQLRLLRQERQRFQQGDRTLKEAVAGVSHDLRTPLTAIRGYLDLMKDQPLSPDQSRYVELIQGRVDHLTGLTEELLRSSVAVIRELPPETVDLQRELEEALAAYYGAFMAQGLSVAADFPREKVTRQLNREALARIFGNVLSNALKYSGGDLTVRLTAEGDISFSNPAPGMTPVTAEKLFHRYFSVETGRGSTGLGLSIARDLAQRMGGSLEASCPDETLTVTVRFPL